MSNTEKVLTKVVDGLHYVKIRDHMLEVFHKAAKKRPEMLDVIPDPLDEDGFMIPEWVVYERQCLLKAINEKREELGLEPIEEKQVLRVEQMACGHTDYASKYTLYCTELALGYGNIRP